MRNITPALLELRQHYESRSITTLSKSQGIDVSELLQHIDDLLLGELIRTQDLDVPPAQLALLKNLLHYRPLLHPLPLNPTPHQEQSLTPSLKLSPLKRQYQTGLLGNYSLPTLA